MSDDIGMIDHLRNRVRELEDKIESLRVSRRVLMNLIDALEKEKRDQLGKLAVQNEKLQRNNSRYAQALMLRNIRITELENQLNRHSAGTATTINPLT